MNKNIENFMELDIRVGKILSAEEFSEIKSRMKNAASDAKVEVSPNALKGKRLPGTPVAADEKGKAERDANKKKYWAQPEKDAKAPSAADPNNAPVTVSITGPNIVSVINSSAIFHSL